MEFTYYNIKTRKKTSGSCDFTSLKNLRLYTNTPFYKNLVTLLRNNGENLAQYNRFNLSILIYNAIMLHHIVLTKIKNYYDLLN